MLSSKHAQPLVSIHMVVRNGERFIGQAISSALHQTYQNFELIVVDDGSVDGTQSEVRKFKDPRIKWLRNPLPGLSRARQLALQESLGKWIAVFDADDVALPERLELAVAAVRPGIVVVGGQMEEINEEGQLISRCHLYPIGEAQIQARLGLGYSVCHGASLFDTQLAQSVGGYFDGEMSFGEDEALFIKLARRGGVINLNQFLIQRRIHRNSACTLFQRRQWVLCPAIFKLETLAEAAYWARLGKAALRARNSKLAKFYFLRSIKTCPLKLNAWWGELKACILSKSYSC